MNFSNSALKSSLSRSTSSSKLFTASLNDWSVEEIEIVSDDTEFDVLAVVYAEWMLKIGVFLSEEVFVMVVEVLPSSDIGFMTDPVWLSLSSIIFI